jgi:AcrR family transcriptional regulator
LERVTKTATAKAAHEPVDRRQEIVEIAAALFKRSGYDRVSMRQIAAGAGILGGSLYHHFKSKRTLFIEIHKQALSNNADRIEAAIYGVTDPWVRLEIACSVHLSLQVDPESISMPMMSDTSAMASDMRRDLVKDRDRFEKVYRKLIDALPLRPEIDRDMYRLLLVSLLNAVPAWYRPGRLSIEEIASQIVMIFRASGLEAGRAPALRKVHTRR